MAKWRRSEITDKNKREYIHHQSSMQNLPTVFFSAEKGATSMSKAQLPPPAQIAQITTMCY